MFVFVCCVNATVTLSCFFQSIKPNLPMSTTLLVVFMHTRNKLTRRSDVIEDVTILSVLLG
jgi:hypothetical protein